MSTSGIGGKTAVPAPQGEAGGAGSYRGTVLDCWGTSAVPTKGVRTTRVSSHPDAEFAQKPSAHSKGVSSVQEEPVAQSAGSAVQKVPQLKCEKRREETYLMIVGGAHSPGEADGEAEGLGVLERGFVMGSGLAYRGWKRQSG